MFNDIFCVSPAAKSDHTDADCFACVLLSHGDFVHVVDKSVPDRLEKEDVVYATDQIILTKEIVEMFTDRRAPSLAGKPRLFFIQVGHMYGEIVLGVIACTLKCHFFLLLRLFLIHSLV